MREYLWVLVSLSLLTLATPAWAREVNIVLQDKSLVRGELIGISSGIIYLKAAGDKTVQYGAETVGEVFDAATGEKIPFTAAPAAAVTPGLTERPTAPVAEASAPKKPMLFFSGTLDSGLVAFSPCRPLEEPYVPGAAYVIGSRPYDLAWGMGMSLEYRFIESVAGGIDFGISRWEKLLAKQGGYGVGDWVWEQNGYMDARIGPFPMDVKYYMDTVFIRLGAKYYPMAGLFQPFVGISFGLYSWQAVIGNREEEKKYSDISSDVAFSASYQLGVDLLFGDFALRFFADLGTAAVNPKFEDLFRDGWTFENTGGEHVQGPYRFGAALGMTF